MDRIPPVESGMLSKPADERVRSERDKKKVITKNILNNAGIFITVLLVFAVIIIVTTDIEVKSFAELASLGLDFFLLLFVTFSAYVLCSDSGTKGGLNSSAYNEAVKRHKQIKEKIISEKLQGKLSDFCYKYVTEELKATRTEILAVVGIDFNIYESEYISKSKDEINGLSITQAQKDAINKANAVEPIKLTPDMLMKQGRAGSHRAPLGISPKARRYIDFALKFLKSFMLSIGISMIAFKIIEEPTWTIFATCCLKLLSVVLNAFGGYKSGFENIVVDTVNYINDQADILEQAYKENISEDNSIVNE